MTALRRHLLRHRQLAAWLVALAFAMKVLVPSGYMLSASDGMITIELCTGFGSQKLAVVMPGMADRGKKQGHGKAEQPCAFAGLSAPSLAGADPILLAGLIAFVTAAVFRPPSPIRASAPARLRPPLRGPPLHA